MKKEKAKSSSSSGNLIVVILILAIVLVGGYIVITGNSTTSQRTYDIIPGIESNYTKDRVELVVIFDFLCPHCYELHKTGAIKQLKEKYGDKLEVKYVGLHFLEDRYVPYDYAILPVLAYEYAKDNERGDEMLEAIYVAYHQNKMNIVDINVLSGIAHSVGLDTSDFASKLYAYRDRAKANDELAFNKYYKKISPIVPLVIMAGNLNVPDPTFTTFENMDKIINSILAGNFPPHFVVSFRIAAAIFPPLSSNA